MLNLRGIPTRVCVNCGSDLFTVQICFDEEYEIAGYLLDCECGTYRNCNWFINCILFP